MEFHTSLSLEQIEDNFKDADVFSEIMNGLQEVAERKNEMTREILFRGKRVDNGEWVYGNLITDNEDMYILTQENLSKGIDIGGWIDGVQCYEVVPETVGQFTGLTDIHKRKIFEGDIACVYDGEYINGVVGYSNEYGSFTIDGTSLLFWLPNVEVIGNIYDNPELLEDGK